jgi:hypothetical protein
MDDHHLWYATQIMGPRLVGIGHFDWPIIVFFGNIGLVPIHEDKGASFGPPLCIYIYVKFQLDQTIWDKNVMLLGTSWGNTLRTLGEI